jgi:hypothetical protein
MAEIANKEERIRTILGVTDADVTDMIIGFPEYLPAATFWCQTAIPNYETLDTADALLFESLILYKTAQLLLPFCQASVWNVQKEKTPHSETTYVNGQYQVVSANIKDHITELLGDLKGDENYGTPFIGFDRSGRI